MLDHDCQQLKTLKKYCIENEPSACIRRAPSFENCILCQATYRAALADSALKYHKISLSQLKNLGRFKCIAKITNKKNPLGQSKNPLSYWKDNTFHKVNHNLFELLSTMSCMGFCIICYITLYT